MGSGLTLGATTTSPEPSYKLRRCLQRSALCGRAVWDKGELCGQAINEECIRRVHPQSASAECIRRVHPEFAADRERAIAPSHKPERQHRHQKSGSQYMAKPYQKMDEFNSFLRLVDPIWDVLERGGFCQANFSSSVIKYLKKYGYKIPKPCNFFAISG